MNNILVHLIYNSALLVPVIILYTTFSFEKLAKVRSKGILMGITTAGIGIIVMLNPFEMAPGIIIDSRSILLGISAMFFPLCSTFIAFISMMTLRIVSGGVGVLAGTLNMTFVVAIGLIWRHLRYNKIIKKEQAYGVEYMVVSLLMHIFVMITLLFLPKEIILDVSKHVAFPLLVVYPITQYLLLMLISRMYRQQRMVEKVKEGELLFKTIFEQAPIGITLTDSTTGKIIDSNTQFKQMMGLTSSNVEHIDWMSITYPDDVAKDIGYMKRLLGREIQSYSIDKRFIRSNNEVIWTNISVSTLFSEFSPTAQHLCMIADINSRKEMEEKITYAYLHDQLTGLPNQIDFIQTLKGTNYPYTIAIADVNGFKMVNDAFNREAGDSLLLQISQILREEKGEEDYVARIGGDEFAIILNYIDEENVNRLINRIQKRIQMLSLHKVVVSLSFGVVVAKDDSLGVDELLKKAEDDLNQNKLHESPSTRSKALYTIVHTLHEKNPREELHSRRVSLLGAQLAKAVGMGSKEIAQMKTVGLLHDIGKINIDESILNKTGPLNKEEWEEMKKHPQKGYRIMMSVPELGELSSYVLSHHERIDGTGYPQGLKGDEIPLQSRIICIVDAFDAMTAWRPYKKMMSEEDAAKELMRCSGTQFDAVLASIFIKQVLHMM